MELNEERPSRDWLLMLPQKRNFHGPDEPLSAAGVLLLRLFSFQHWATRFLNPAAHHPHRHRRRHHHHRRSCNRKENSILFPS